MHWRVEQAPRRAWVVFLALTLLALVIRLAWLGRKSLWLDEVYSLGRASDSVAKIVEVIDDPHPPLFYVVLHYALTLGRDEFALRLPSAIWGAVSAGLIYLLGKRWAGVWVGMSSAVLLAIAPMHVWFSQEARMYSLSCALGLLAVWSLSEAIVTGRRFAWIGWIVATTLGLYTHYLTLLLLLIELVMFGPICYWAGELRRRVLPGVSALAGVVLLYVPWFTRPSNPLGSALGGTLWYFTSVLNFLAARGAQVTTRQLFNALMVIGVIGIAVLLELGWRAVAALKRQAFSPGTGLAVAMSVLYLAALLVSVWTRGYSFRRQVLLFFPYFLLVVAWGMSGLPRRTRLFSGLVAITLPLLIITLTCTEQEDWRSLATFISKQGQSEDVILFSASYYDMCLEYYYRGTVERAGAVPADVPGRLTELTQKRARVWLILCGEVFTDPGGTIPAWLGERRSVVGQYSFVGIRVLLYGAPS